MMRPRRRAFTGMGAAQSPVAQPSVPFTGSGHEPSPDDTTPTDAQSVRLRRRLVPATGPLPSPKPSALQQMLALLNK